MATGDNLLTALIIVLTLNVMMFFAGQGIESLEGDNPFLNKQMTLNTFNSGNVTGEYEVPTTAGVLLPGGEGTSISPDTGLSFTDIFTSIKSWFVDTTGLGWVLSILEGPKVLLSMMMPGEALAGAVWALTALWYGITLLIIVSYIWGR